MAKNPDTPKKPSKTPKSKAPNSRHRPDVQPIGPALAELLNPAINRGDAGMGSGTGLRPPPDNSKDRRSGGEAAAHRARASTRGQPARMRARKRDAVLPNSPPKARANRPARLRRSPAGQLRHRGDHPHARSGTGKTARLHHRGGRRRSAGAAAAQQDGGARRRRHRGRAGSADPRRPPRIQGRGRPGENLDAASPAPPGKIRRRRAAS